jgi:mRNA interferase MazF
MNRGEIWWAELGVPNGSEPGYRRPVLIIQSNDFNESKIATIICIIITSNESIREAPGNVFISSKESGLPKNSVINVSQIITLDKEQLTKRIGNTSKLIMENVEEGILLILGFNNTRHFN